MKNRDKKPVPFNRQDKEILRNYDLKMQIIRKSPRVYYSEDGNLITIKK